MSKRDATESEPEPEPEGLPPIFGTWGRFYTVVLANTVLLYLLLLLFSRVTR